MIGLAGPPAVHDPQPRRSPISTASATTDAAPVAGDVAVIGQGYAVRAGHAVTGCDVEVRDLRQGRSPIGDISDNDLAGMPDTGRYLPVAGPSALEAGRPGLTVVPAAARTTARRDRIACRAGESRRQSRRVLTSK